MAVQRITLTPDPPESGKPVKICYDFSGTNLAHTHLKVTFTPGVVSPATYVVTPEDPCVVVTVPDGAITMLIQDIDGPSPDKSAVID